MNGEDAKRYDLTEEASQRSDEASTAAARQAESDDLYEDSGLNTTPSPDGDSFGENKVATSLSEE